jgi:ABC-type transport system involved in multi-copper enzyme maturation permease subunit
VKPIILLASVTLRESARRRLFIVVPIVTVMFMALYWIGNHYAFKSVTEGITEGPGGLVDERSLAGASLLGLSIFMTLFLASVVGVFLTMGTVRGDAESGLLQPFVVRPVRRFEILVARFLGACAVAVPYALLLFGLSIVVTGIIGDWWPSNPILAGAELAAAVAVIIALSILGSIFLSTIANGVVVFMLYGAGLLAGLLGQIGEVLTSPGLETTAKVMAWALPFEALYQGGLNDLTVGESGFTRVIVELGPLGGAEAAGPELWAWVVVYLAIIGTVATKAFSRRDL